MSNYNISDIDALRSRANLTYEEAVASLERNDGDVTRCLVELERQGRLNVSPNAQQQDNGTRSQWSPQRPHWDGQRTKRFLFGRLMVRKGERVVVDLPVIFLIFAALAAPWLAVISAALAFGLGYRTSWQRGEDVDLSKEGFQTMFGQAGENFRAAADSVKDAVRQAKDDVQE